MIGGGFVTVTVTGAAVAVLPAASRATAVIVCVPSGSSVVSHERVYGAAVSSAPRLVPSTLSWTPATPVLSLAAAVTETVADTEEAAAGALIETVGGDVSVGPVEASGLTPT